MRIHLTFDDGPDPEWTPRLLDLLLFYEETATFFVDVSRCMGGKAGTLVYRMCQEGHNVEFHCFEHVNHWDMSRPAILADATTGLGRLKELGVCPGLWRPPFGEATGDTFSVGDEVGLWVVTWHHDPQDYKNLSPQAMEAAIPPYTLLLHDAVRSDQDRETPANTLGLVKRLLEGKEKV